MTTVSPLSLLAQVNDPVQLRALPDTALPKLADELRAFMLTQVAATGGHLASGLGTVELAIALHHS
ncbi:MAG: hypothetical protein EBR15_03985, partial [Gammaproteobacteria bacterium]|nr:hypothetical protein [Gammaproteobacteria bacterium]